MRFVRPTVTVAFSCLLATTLLSQTTERVSVNTIGAPANDESSWPSISSDGRFVAFQSDASNLVGADTNGFSDIFVHDRMTGQIKRGSVDSIGTQGNAHSRRPSISSDGRFVAFDSGADNLVEGDTRGVQDVFVHDRVTGQTTRASVDSVGNQGHRGSISPSISSDGRFVAFSSSANNLTGFIGCCVSQVLVHDRMLGQTAPVSVDSMGTLANFQTNLDATISSDGRFVAFESFANNLVPGDTNARWDLFVHDRMTSETTLVSFDFMGRLTSDSFNPSISADGRFVAFDSDSPLLRIDTNAVRDIFLHDRMTGQTTLLSVESTGRQGLSDSLNPSISSDGQVVAFESDAGLAGSDSNDAKDIFVHDRLADSLDIDGDGTADALTDGLLILRFLFGFRGDTLTNGVVASGCARCTAAEIDATLSALSPSATAMRAAQTTERVSVNTVGVLGNGSSFRPSISSDGRFVAFQSRAGNPVGGDTNGVGDVFVHARLTGQTTRVSVDSSGTQGNGTSGAELAISSDGRFVVFGSIASNLVGADTGGIIQLVVHDRMTGQTSSVSVNSMGNLGNNSSLRPSISSDGHLIAFESDAGLAGADSNNARDIFVHDLFVNSLDIDGNGAADALTDGLLILRLLFGFRGAALTEGAVAPDCTRCTATEIEAILTTLLP